MTSSETNLGDPIVYNHDRFEASIFIHIARESISLLKFLLEANDNLGLIRTIDSERSIVEILFPRSRQPEILNFLDAIGEIVKYDPVLKPLNYVSL